MKSVILLADDSPTIQRLVTQTFADSDFEIISVSNGDAAVKKFEELRPRLVLADIYMPGKNGYEVCAYVRKHAELGDTPVVLLAGAFDAFDEVAAGQAGSSAHITKPFEPHALVNLVVSLLPEPTRTEEAKEEIAMPAAAAMDTTVESETPAPEPLRFSTAAASPSASPSAVPAETKPEADSGDLMGLQDLFKPAEKSVNDAEIERIADRVIQKLSTQVIENVAWDVVPDITTKVLREELKRKP